MKEIIIKDKSFKFIVRIIKLYQFLIEHSHQYELAKQILRSGTSLGVNIEEATGGISKADFKQKISISYKEARETQYWVKITA